MDKVNFFAKNILIAFVLLFGVEVFGATNVPHISFEEIDVLINSARREAEFNAKNPNGVKYKRAINELFNTFATYKLEASKGDAYSKYVLGMFCVSGFDGAVLAVNKKKALAWLIESANGGYVQAMWTLGEIYSTEKVADTKEALKWFLCAAENGDVRAQMKVSRFYEEGIGTVANPEAAFMWCERAANNNEVEAQYKLATMYERGFGVGRDRRKSVYWLKSAARLGNKEAAKRIEEFDSLKAKLVEVFEKSRHVPRMLAEADRKRSEGRALQMAKSSHNGFASRGGYGLGASTDNYAANRRGEALCAEADAIVAEVEKIKAEENKYLKTAFDILYSVELKSSDYRHALDFIPLSYQSSVLIAINCKTRKIVKFNAAESLAPESLDLLSEIQ